MQTVRGTAPCSVRGWPGGTGGPQRRGKWTAGVPGSLQLREEKPSSLRLRWCSEFARPSRYQVFMSKRPRYIDYDGQNQVMLCRRNRNRFRDNRSQPYLPAVLHRYSAVRLPTPGMQTCRSFRSFHHRMRNKIRRRFGKNMTLEGSKGLGSIGHRERAPPSRTSIEHGVLTVQLGQVCLRHPLKPERLFSICF